MCRSIFTGLLLFIYTATVAQTRQKLEITAATVFQKGAELTSNTTVMLKSGENELLFTNVAANVNTSSLMINATNDVVIESAVFQRNYLEPDMASPVATRLNDSITRLQAVRDDATDRLLAVSEQITILQQNRVIKGDQTGMSVADLMKLVDAAGEKMEKCNVRKRALEAEIKSLNETISRISNQLMQQTSGKLLPGSQLLVKAYAPKTCNAHITISYVTPDAGWTPLYDIIAVNTSSPVKIYYKANVYQNTGIDWNKVKLQLSGGNPNETVQAPVVRPLHLYYYTPQPIAMQQFTPQPARQETVLAHNDIKSLSTTEIADATSMTPGIYQAQRGRAGSISGARKTGTLYIVDGVQVQNIGEGQSSMDHYVTSDNTGMNVTFDIELPYTIPADGNRHLVAVKKQEVPATYRYFAAPKYDKDAFLQAAITGWENLNIMPGLANIFFDGTYIGQGILDTRSVKDTLFLSMGRDKKIIIKRDADAAKRSVKSLGTNVTETFGYTITVRNTRKETVQLMLTDQIPVSKDNSIVIDNVETGEGIIDENTGITEWALNPAPGVKTELRLAYRVKYPKNKTVMGLR